MLTITLKNLQKNKYANRHLYMLNIHNCIVEVGSISISTPKWMKQR